MALRKDVYRVVCCCLLVVLALVVTAPLGQAQGKLDALDQILGYVESARIAAAIPGLALGIASGDTVYVQQGFGVLGVEDDRLVDEHTIFQIGSTSKAFTSMLLAHLVAEDILRWDDYVLDHYPDLRLHDPWVTRHIQIRDLCSQQSGLAAYAGDMNAFFGWDREYMLEALRHIPPRREFRSDYTYVNGMLLLAAKVVENKTGMSYEEALDHYIFGPLRMTSSDLDPNSIRLGANAARPHFPTVTDEGRLTAEPLALDSVLFTWPYEYGPAGGINSNIVDMTKWLQFHLNQGRVDDEAMFPGDQLQYLYRPVAVIVSAMGELVAYAQSWIYSRAEETVIWHNGDTSVYHTKIAFVPEADLGVVILSNVGTIAVVDAIVNDVIDLLMGRDLDLTALEMAAELRDMEPSTWLPDPGLDVTPYLGTYFHPVYGSAEVTDSGHGSLVLWIGPEKSRRAELFPVGDHGFEGLLEDFIEMGQLHFVVTENQAQLLLAEFAWKEGSGAFERVD